jgi:drug/metabolite transporter (DMT)-like permease
MVIEVTHNNSSLANKTQQENFVGSCLIVLSMAAFAVEDSVIKVVSGSLPVGQILFTLGVGGTIAFVLTALILRRRLWTIDVLTLPMHLRVVLEIFGRVFYSLALVFTSLASSTMILQATPIVVVIGAAIIFKEKVGVLRWVAIVIGLFGVLIIIQPTADNFSFLSILAVLGMLGFAGRDLASRAVSKSLNILTLGMHGFLSVAMSGIVLTLFFDEPFLPLDINTGLFMMFGVLLGVVGYAALVSAMRIGEVSAITPFRYSRIVFGLAIGVFLFNESISLTTVLGCMLIVVSSLIVLSPTRQ